jgi:putative transcription factor
MECELCGKKEPSLKHILIEGAEMWVCEECMRFGTLIPEKSKRRQKGKGSKISTMSYDTSILEENTEFFPGWGRKIKEAREKKGLTREELGARIEEPTTVIAKYENEELFPTDKAVAAIEKELKITLKQEIPQAQPTSKSQSKITLGDVITKKGKKK